MRYRSLLLIFLVISSCGVKEEKSGKKKDSMQEEYLQKGGEIASLTQSELLKNLRQAMTTGGPGYAIDFCNLRAIELKDSLSQQYNCEIRRIATKYRNPADMPETETEKNQLFQYQSAFQKGDSLKPEVYFFDDRVEYYQPIFIGNGTCLICHGNRDTQIAEEILEKIDERYPDDLATGFALNDFRGAWKITFLPENK